MRAQTAAILLLCALALAPAPARPMSALGHALVANALLGEVRRQPKAYPAELARIAADPRLTAYFLGGAIDPDQRLALGAGATLARRVHRGLPGAWALELWRGARTPEERAYTLGWITHYAADRVLHPWLVGHGLEHDSESPAHVSFETALDVLVASRAGYPAAELLTRPQHAAELVGRALAALEGSAGRRFQAAAPCGLRVAAEAVQFDGGTLAKCKLLAVPRIRGAEADPALAAVAQMAGRRAVQTAGQHQPSKEVAQLYQTAVARGVELIASALRGEWDPLNRDLDTGGAPTAAFRPKSVAPSGYYYAVLGSPEDRGREAEVMRQLTRRGHGNLLRCAGLPPKQGGVIRLVPPPKLGEPAEAAGEFTPVCIGPYGSRELALKVLVDLTTAAQAAYREATGRPAANVGLAVDEPRYAF